MNNNCVLSYFDTVFETWIIISEHPNADAAYLELSENQAIDKINGDVYRYRIVEGRTIYEGN